MINSFLSTTRGMRVQAAILVLLWVIYAGLTILAPAAEATNRYGLSLAQVNLLRATILVPYLFIWLAGLFAVMRFRYYTALVGNAPERPAFRKMTMGLCMLLLSVIIPPFIRLIAAFYPESTTIQQNVTIVANYALIIIYLSAFWFFFQASQVLKTMAPAVDSKKPNRLRLTLIVSVSILSLAYIWSVFHNEFRTVSDHPLVRPTYYLPDALILLTVLLPYVLIWMWGSLAIANVKNFAQTVPGVLYSKAFLSIAWGLSLIIGLSILLQFLSQASAILNGASLGYILAIIYFLFFLIALSYLLLARGARALAAIEEV